MVKYVGAQFLYASRQNLQNVASLPYHAAPRFFKAMMDGMIYLPFRVKCEVENLQNQNSTDQFCSFLHTNVRGLGAV
jgi:hypothetical protein